MGFVILPFLYPYFIKERAYSHKAYEGAIAALLVKSADSSGELAGSALRKPMYHPYSSSSGDQRGDDHKKVLFYFNPNTASVDDWRKLGCRDKTIATIQNYLKKGGKFYRKEDLAKIWGLHEDELQRLMPYIQIPAAPPNISYQQIQDVKKIYKERLNSIEIIDINTADTAAFIALPGIGSKLSKRIITFREKLGGFYSVDQIAETFGLPDSVFQKIKPVLRITHSQPTQININTAAIDELKAHPYIRFAIGNAIVQYRLQHGKYDNVEDIKRIMAVTEEIYHKIAPYLTLK